MDQKELVTQYKKGTLDTSNLKKKLELSKDLKPRPLYRHLEYFMTIGDIEETHELLRMKVEPENIEKFEKGLDRRLKHILREITERVNKNGAWTYLGLKPEDYTQDKFDGLSTEEKFSVLNTMLSGYNSFLDLQKVADLRGEIEIEGIPIDEDAEKKMALFMAMIESNENKNVKSGISDFESRYMNSILKYSKKRDISFAAHMEKQAKYIVRKYNFYKEYYKDEDYEELADFISAASKATKFTKIKTAKILSQLCETEREQRFLESDIRDIGLFSKKREEFKKLKEELERKQAREAEEKRIAEELQKQKEEEERKALEARQREIDEEKKREEAERLRIIGEDDGYTGEFDKKIEALRQTVSAKEAVYPLFLTWIDREDITLSKRLGKDRMKSLFDKIKKIEIETGRRVSLFVITNADKDVTKRRLEDLKAKSEEAGLPRLVEGAFGGYASFMIDRNGEVTDTAIVDPKDRKKVIDLIDSGFFFGFPKELVDQSEQNYIRYKLEDKPAKTHPMSYLRYLAGQMLEVPRIKSQAIAFQPFIENKAVGIDVILCSQLKGIKRLRDYYEAKYYIEKGKSSTLNVNGIDKFIEELKPEEDIEH